MKDNDKKLLEEYFLGCISLVARLSRQAEEL